MLTKCMIQIIFMYTGSWNWTLGLKWVMSSWPTILHLLLCTVISRHQLRFLWKWFFLGGGGGGVEELLGFKRTWKKSGYNCSWTCKVWIWKGLELKGLPILITIAETLKKSRGKKLFLQLAFRMLNQCQKMFKP